MKARGLRIGNWVNHKGGFGQVQVTQEMLGDEKLFRMQLMSNPPQDLIKPIPLTEEWLVKFGFTESVKLGMYKDLTSRMVLKFYKIPNQLDLIQDGKNISFAHGRIKYVHQLQNLYYALTGEEL